MSAPSPSPTAASPDVLPVSSPHDPRVYSIRTLPNGLARMIVTDKHPHTQAIQSSGKGAAASAAAASKPAVVALSVRVGHWSDPAAIPGLAHFLEHMLFMGTRVHPGENSWEDYLSCHGGSSNAFTDSEHTCFYFEVNRAYLQEALERFASFFTCPLFAASATRREINAVDSEFRDGFNSDSERLSELVNYTASLVHPTHPFGKWGWGNKDSLDTHLRAAAAKAKPAVKGKPTPSKVAAAAKASGTAIDLRTSLKAFHARWYSAHAMKLVVYDAAGDAAEIAQWIESGYSAIKNNGLPLQDFSKEGNPFEAPAGSRSAEAANGAGAASAKSKKSSKAASAAAPSPSPSPAAPLNCYGKIYHVVPIKDTYKLSLSWVLPPMQAHFRVKPTHYAEHLIGHEGSGSLFSLLRDEGWVTSLCAGVSEGGNSKNTALDLMQISITLTKLGAASVPRVLDACFQYLSLIRQPANIRESIWLELQSLSALAFLFAESPDPSEFVQEAAMNLQVMPAEEVLRGQFLHERFDRELTTLVLNTLRVDNCRIDLLSANTKALAASMQRPLLKAAWFHTSYFEEMLTTEIMEAWAKYDREPQAIDKRLHLPKPNEFIPTDFEIRVEPAPAATAAAAAAAAASSSAAAPVLPSQPARAVRPTRICPSLRGEYWHNLDSEFTLPRAHVHLLLSSPVVYASAANVALTELLLKVLVDFLSEYAYAASLAELEFSVESLRSGVEFKFAGFSHRIADFVRRVVGALGEGPQGLEAFLATDDAATRFEGLREKTHRHFRHQYYQPAKQVEHLRLMLLQQHKFPIEDITDAAKQCTMQQLVAHLRAIRLNLRIIGLVDGNLLRSEGEAMFSSIEASILPDAAVTPPLRDELTLRLPVGHALYVESRARNARESNSAVEAYWALAPSRVDLKSALSVLESLLHEPAFDHLRSKLQLGYKVYTGVRNTHGILGFVCGIQSADFKCDRLNQEIHRFMFEVFYPYLLRLSEEKYLAAREALIAELLYADSALIERVDREWEEITENRSYCWQRSSVLAAQVATVTLAQVTQLFEHYLLGIRAEPPQLATVGVTTSSSTGAKDEAASMTDVESASLARETSNDAVNAVAQLALSVEEKQAAKPAPATSSKRSSRKGGAASAAAASPSPPPLDPALEALVTSRVQAALHAPVVHRRHLVVACFGHPRKGRNQREEEEDEEEEEDDEGADGSCDEDGSDGSGSDVGSSDGDDSDMDAAPADDSASSAADTLWFTPAEWTTLVAAHASDHANAEGSKPPPNKKQRNGRTKQTDMSRSKQAEAEAKGEATESPAHASPPAVALPPLGADGLSVACACTAVAAASSSSSSASSTPASAAESLAAHPAASQCEHHVHVRSLAALAAIKDATPCYPFSGGPETDLPEWACEQSN